MQDLFRSGQWDNVRLPMYFIGSYPVDGPFNGAMCDHMRQLYVSNTMYRIHFRNLSDAAFLASQNGTYFEKRVLLDMQFRELHLYAHNEVTFN